jgi:hypothetical protein
VVYYKFRPTWPSSGASKIAVGNCCTPITEHNSKIHPRLCVHVLLCVCSVGWFLLRVVCSCLCSWLFLIFSPHIFGRMEVVVLKGYGSCSIPGLLVARAGGVWWLRAQEVHDDTQLQAIDFALWDKRSLCFVGSSIKTKIFPQHY